MENTILDVLGRAMSIWGQKRPPKFWKSKNSTIHWPQTFFETFDYSSNYIWIRIDQYFKQLPKIYWRKLNWLFIILQLPIYFLHFCPKYCGSTSTKIKSKHRPEIRQKSAWENKASVGSQIKILNRQSYQTLSTSGRFSASEHFYRISCECL